MLVLETGSLTAIVAAVEGGEVRAIATLTEQRALARDLIGVVSGVLEQAGWAPNELGGIAAGTGPGSWTSLRVGLTTAKTLALSLGTPLAGIPTFQGIATAVAARESGILLTLSPCRPGELYGAIFQIEAGEALPLIPARIATLDDHLRAAREFSEGELLVEGEAVADSDTRRVSVLPSQIALALAMAAEAKISTGDADDPLNLVPLYLAPSSAERNLCKTK